jgi:hypothetical protein
MDQTTSGTTNPKRKAPDETGNSGSLPKKLKPIPEYNLDKHNTAQHTKLQLASYALEILSRTGRTQSSFFVCLFVGDVIEFWYYSSVGIFRSTRMSWILELEKFAAILVAIASCDHEHFGIHAPNLSPPDNFNPSIPPASLVGYRTTMQHEDKGTLALTLRTMIYVQYSIIGRNTCIYEVTTNPQISDDALVLKITTQFATRTPEYELILHARKMVVGKHLPENHMWSDCKSPSPWCASQGIWGKLTELQKEDGKETFEDRTQDFLVMTKYERIEKKLTPQNMFYLFNQLFDSKSHLSPFACDAADKDGVCSVG